MDDILFTVAPIVAGLVVRHALMQGWLSVDEVREMGYVPPMRPHIPRASTYEGYRYDLYGARTTDWTWTLNNLFILICALTSVALAGRALGAW